MQSLLVPGNLEVMIRFQEVRSPNQEIVHQIKSQTELKRHQSSHQNRHKPYMQADFKIKMIRICENTLATTQKHRRGFIYNSRCHLYFSILQSLLQTVSSYLIGRCQRAAGAELVPVVSSPQAESSEQDQLARWLRSSPHRVWGCSHQTVEGTLLPA